MPKDKSALPMTLSEITFDSEDNQQPTEIVKETESTSEPPALPDGVIIDKNGQWRNKETGQLVKGGPAHPKAGRPARLTVLDEILRDNLGANLETLIGELMKVAMYDPDQLVPDKDGKMVQRKRHYFSSGHKLEALKIIMAYYYGKPSENKVVDINKNIKFEGKLSTVAALVSKNAGKIKDLKNVTPAPLKKELEDVIEEDMIIDAD